MTDKQIIIDGEYWRKKYGDMHIRLSNKVSELEKQLQVKEQECEQLRETMHKDFCTHYVLGECSQKHHNNCVGRNQCIKDLEQKLEKIKEHLETVSYLAPVTTRVLKHSIKQIIEE